jgi:hypothetical protein
MIRRGTLAALAILTLVAGLFITAPAPVRAQSDALVRSLSDIKALSQSDFVSLARWAANGAQRPFFTSSRLERTQANILALGDRDREAVLLWLRGNGRAALYARGASSYDVGPPRAPADIAATATPPPWRDVPLASLTLEGNVEGHIQILGGFAAVKLDGTSAIACISFKNLSPMTARRVIFEFPLFDAQGGQLGTLTLDRTGEFSSNVAIMTYDSFSDWLGGGAFGHHGRADNCVQRTLPTAAVPLLQARSMSYRVMRVDYNGGPSWTP